MNDSVHYTIGNSKTITKRLLSFLSSRIQFPDFKHLNFCQLVIPSAFSIGFSNYRNSIRNVLPRSSFNNLLSGAKTNPKFFGNNTTRNNFGLISCSYFQNLFICKFAVIVLSPLPVIKFPLFNSIKHIFQMRSKKQMIWPYARFIVAFMKNIYTIWNFSIMQYPRYSMSGSCFFSKPERTISSSCSTTNPKPTPFPLCHNKHFGKKGFFVEIQRLLWILWNWSNVFLHKSARLICATLPATSIAREHFYFLKFQSNVNII